MRRQLRLGRWTARIIALAVLALGFVTVHGQVANTSSPRLNEDQRDSQRRQRFTHQDARVEDEAAATSAKPTEAPAGFDDLTNGFDPQGANFEQLQATNVKAGRSFNDNRFIFEEFETKDD